MDSHSARVVLAIMQLYFSRPKGFKPDAVIVADVKLQLRCVDRLHGLIRALPPPATAGLWLLLLAKLQYCWIHSCPGSLSQSMISVYFEWGWGLGLGLLTAVAMND